MFEEYVKSLNINDFRIINFPSLIFLCGGPINKTHEEPSSARAFFLKYIEHKFPEIRKQIILADQMKDWFEEKLYKDLINFEEDISSLSSLTILFVESPGSFTELGVFSKKSHTKESCLFVIVESDRASERSFITLGPIKYIEKIAEDLGYKGIYAYKWETNGSSKLEDDDAHDLVENIREHLSKLNKASQLDLKNNKGHLLLLIVDLIYVSTICRESEIIDLLNKLGITHKDAEIARYLYVLEKLKLICKHKYSHNTYYLPSPTQDKVFIKHSFQEGVRTRDILRWKHIIQESYQDMDPRKVKALRNFFRSEQYIQTKQ